MTFRIPEDLDANEQQQFIDALNWYKQNPTAAPMKFVLAQKSRERVIRIGQEFGIDVYPGSPGPTPAPTPSGDIVTPHSIEDVSWGDGRRVLLNPWGCETRAARFVVPTSPAVYGQAGRCGLAEFEGGGTAFRQASLSKIPGDFRTADPTGVNGPFVLSPGATSTIDFGVGYPGLPDLVPGQFYFMSFRNFDPSANNGAGACTVPSGESRAASYSFVWPH